MRLRGGVLLLALAGAFLALGGCSPADPDPGRLPDARGFPRAGRAIEHGRDDFTPAEAQRDRNGEAAMVMDAARVQPGMTVADIGAGEGYYTMRLAPRVGRKGRVLAEDIDRAVLARLGDRVERERLDNVSIAPGSEADPNLPPASFDRVFLVHMYHEVSEPYAFLWHLAPALRPGGRVVVVESARVGDGMTSARLFCEFGAVGFRLMQFARKPALDGYYAEFEAPGRRPAPWDIHPCDASGGGHG